MDGFWSISVYNGEGYLEQNKENAYTLNNITAKKGSRTAPSPSSSAAATVKLPTACRSRLVGTTSSCTYRPRKEVLDGIWKFPEAEVVR